MVSIDGMDIIDMLKNCANDEIYPWNCDECPLHDRPNCINYLLLTAVDEIAMLQHQLEHSARL